MATCSRPALGTCKPKGEWSLTRVDVRSRLNGTNDVIARVELLHVDRGRVCNIASGRCGLEAAIEAVRQIVGTRGTLKSLSAHLATMPGGDNVWAVAVLSV